MVTHAMSFTRKVANQVRLAKELFATAHESNGKIDMTGYELIDLVSTYLRAWSEPNEPERQKLFARVWDAKGRYSDPTAQVEGVGDLLEHVSQFIARYPGAKLQLDGGVDEHHQCFRFAWRMVLSDGQVKSTGIDFGELSLGGKIQNIVGFFDPLPSK